MAVFPELTLAWQGQLSDSVTGLAWSPTVGYWAASAANGEVVWQTEVGAAYHLCEANGQSVERLSFSADGLWLAAGGQAGKVFIWSCADRLLGEPPQLHHIVEIDRWVDHLLWHPTLAQLAIGHDAEIWLWDPVTANRVVNLRFDRSSVFDLGWHPDGSPLAVAGYKGVQLWSLGVRPQRVNSLEVDTATTQLAWSDDGRYLAAGNLDRTVTIVDRQSQLDDPWILQGCPGKIRQLQWLAATHHPCLAVAAGSELLLWDLESDLAQWSGRCLSAHQSAISVLASHPQLPIVISGDRDGHACLWSAAGEIEQILTVTAGSVTALAWHQAGAQVVLGHLDGQIEVWKL